jgi:hypothetical protein
MIVNDKFVENDEMHIVEYCVISISNDRIKNINDLDDEVLIENFIYSLENLICISFSQIATIERLKNKILEFESKA